MSFSGGVYTLPGPALVTGEVVSATENNQFRNDVAGAFNLTFLRNGTSTATANLPMGGYKLTGLGVATTSGDALSYGQAAVISDLTASGTVTISSGTANGVAYLNGSKVLTTGSALTFDGTNLGIGTTSPVSGAGYGTLTLNGSSGGQLAFTEAGVSNKFIYSDTTNLHYRNNNTGAQIWYTSGSEQMRLTSTGLGIGTSSPNVKLQINNGTFLVETVAGNGKAQILLGSGGANYGQIQNDSGGVWSLGYGAGYSSLGTPVLTWNTSGNVGIGTSSPANKLDVVGGSGRILVKSTSTASNADIRYTATNADWVVGVNSVSGTGEFTWYNVAAVAERMRLDSSGNLGLGVTPSAWSGFRAMQIGSTTSLWSGTSGNASSFYTNNGYFNGSSRIYLTNGYATEYIQGQGQHIWYTAPSGTAGSAISFTQAMTLDASGNLGLGTSSSSSFRLDVVTSGNNGIRVNAGTSGADQLYMGNSSGVPVFGTLSNSVVTFIQNGSERMRIDSSGNLLVGTTSISGADSSGISFAPGTSYQNIGHPNGTASGYSYINFGYNGTQIGYITQNGTTAVAYNTTSDYRLKENIQPMQNALGVVQQLNPVTYTWKADGSDGQGFIAHELQAVVPDCVTGKKDAVDADGKPVYQGIDTSFLVATLTAAIKELKAELDATKAEVAALKGN